MTTERSTDLFPAEQLVRETLPECTQRFTGLEIWIAGGWVRNRLLGMPCLNLGIALSNVTGNKFGEFSQDLFTNPEVEAKYRQKAAALGITFSKFTRFRIVKRNEQKAKELETAGRRLLGLDVGFVISAKRSTMATVEPRRWSLALRYRMLSDAMLPSIPILSSQEAATCQSHGQKSQKRTLLISGPWLSTPRSPGFDRPCSDK